ncbi:MAG: DUF3018 family protein [Paraburkholderia sp.]|uniref:antitoxin MazE family protein n=1 Tax=Paraburkholderia sp. TaxID=1926495 RepID=UPI001210BA7E|nr:antitoxin MazE family protein [Paraburkholderia sp.]TAM06387.1 MAG: DUF3018 family protein [Paraburkholderia sp.]
MTSRGERGEQRQAMRRAGMRLIQIWVPDTRAPGFADECRRQSRLLAETAAESESEDLDFIEQASEGAWE